MFLEAELESKAENTIVSNDSLQNFSNTSTNGDYIFDRIDVKIIFITLYSIVFFFCFFGKYLKFIQSIILRSLINVFMELNKLIIYSEQKNYLVYRLFSNKSNF